MEVLFWLLRNWFTCICTGWANCSPSSCQLWQLWSGQDTCVSFCRCQQQQQCEYHQYTHSTHAWLGSVGRFIYTLETWDLPTYRSKGQVILATTLKRWSCWACRAENNWCLHRNTFWRPLLRNTHPPYMQQGCVQWGWRVYGINFDIPFSVQRTLEVINVISHLPGGSLFWFPGRSHPTLWSLAVCKYGYHKWSKTEGGNVLGTSTLSAVVSFKVTRKRHSPPTHSLVSVEIETTCVLARHLGSYFTPLLGGMLCSLVTSLGGVVYQVHSLHRSLITTVSCPDPNSHEEKGLVAIEWFLGCAEPAVLIFDEPMDLPGIRVNGHAIMQAMVCSNQYCNLAQPINRSIVTRPSSRVRMGSGHKTVYLSDFC